MSGQPEVELRSVYAERGYPNPIVDELVKLSHDIARAHGLTLEEAASIVRREFERVLGLGGEQ